MKFSAMFFYIEMTEREMTALFTFIMAVMTLAVVLLARLVERCF